MNSWWPLRQLPKECSFIATIVISRTGGTELFTQLLNHKILCLSFQSSQILSSTSLLPNQLFSRKRAISLIWAMTFHPATLKILPCFSHFVLRRLPFTYILMGYHLPFPTQFPDLQLQIEDLVCLVLVPWGHIVRTSYSIALANCQLDPSWGVPTLIKQLNMQCPIMNSTT